MSHLCIGKYLVGQNQQLKLKDVLTHKKLKVG